MDYAVKIRSVTGSATTDPQGVLRQTKRVAFMVGPHGPFFEDFFTEDFTDAKVKERLQAVANTINRIC